MASTDSKVRTTLFVGITDSERGGVNFGGKIFGLVFFYFRHSNAPD